MFDIGFWELTVIMVVALLVVGPERLPRLARTLGLWLGKARRFVSTVKADIDRELAADELKRTLAKQAQMPELYDMIDEVEQAIKPADSEKEADRPASAEDAQEPAQIPHSASNDAPDKADDKAG